MSSRPWTERQNVLSTLAAEMTPEDGVVVLNAVVAVEYIGADGERRLTVVTTPDTRTWTIAGLLANASEDVRKMMWNES